jgi:hypothetical protein
MRNFFRLLGVLLSNSCRVKETYLGECPKLRDAWSIRYGDSK